MADAELERVHGEYATVHRELERVHGEYENVRQRVLSADAELEDLRQRAEALDAIFAGGWWRIRNRLLPLLKLVSRRQRGSAPSRRPRSSRKGCRFPGAARSRRR
jgi:hypothetical protein